ncbi:type IV pilus assembly protein FimV, partial [Paracidovorax avenae]|uniref:type IV pilus assembly protein FimV n=1 Tax=Paracidovorax avenae TaxID=80867 RepID=UPI003EBF80AF
MKISNAILGASLSALATGASALSLGASHGTVVLGAPVDLVFDVQPDPGSDVESSCVRVRLLSGDTVVPDSKVQVTPVPATGGRNPAVRVRAFITADEPVVTAAVSAGCSGGVTRRYTFLAQLPEAVAAASPSGPVDIGRLAGAGASATGSAAVPATQGMGGRGPRAAASGAAPSSAPRASRQAA